MNSLDDQSPTGLILKALGSEGRAAHSDQTVEIKEDEFYLGVIRDGAVRPVPHPGQDSP